MEEYGTRKKKYVFYDHDHLHAKLVCRLAEDGFMQMALIREFIKAYIDYNPDIIKWCESNPKLKISKRTLRRRKAQMKKLELENAKFNLDQEEVDEIFDILADEMGD